MVDRVITEDIGAVSGDAVSEFGTPDTIVVKKNVTVQAQSAGDHGIVTDGFGDEIIIEGIAQSLADTAIEVGVAGDDASGGNIFTIAPGGAVAGGIAGIIAHGDGNHITNANVIRGDIDAIRLDGDAGRVANSGSIVGVENGVLATEDDVTIINNGFMSADAAIRIDGGNGGKVTNAGAANGSNFGIIMIGEGGTVTNTGTAAGSTAGIGVVNSDSIDTTVPDTAIIANRGEVISTGFGIFGGGDDITIRNGLTGEVNALSATGIGVRIETAVGENQSLINDGLIHAQRTAVFATSGNESVVNRGTIEGAVTLGAGNDVYSGANGTLKGVLDGGAGKDILITGAGNETLKGGNGFDKLAGGAGHDIFAGGAGADTFIFTKVTDSVIGANRDVIKDFAGVDFIDLKGIDANTKVGGNQAFSFLGFGNFTGEAGELHTLNNAQGVFVEGDINGDGKADFQISLLGINAMNAGDFIL